ncbi:MAG: hypothetical protein QOF41_200 [Methylobacteriaceae bacterium]|nr:hypothetical protein [Methylobacteriaceae bacterium]
MRRLAFFAVLASLPASAALADAPTLNVQATCRATPAVNLDQQATYDNCMRSENAARDRLNKTWAKMRVDWRSTCLKTTTLGGVPSYVELLTCVEMREAAANGQSGAPSGSMTGGRSVGVGSGSPAINSPVPGATTGGTAGTTGYPSGATSAPGNPGNSINGGLGAGSAGSTGMSSGRSVGSGSPAGSSPSPAGSAGTGTAGGAGSAGSAGSAGGASAGGGGGGH